MTARPVVLCASVLFLLACGGAGPTASEPSSRPLFRAALVNMEKFLAVSVPGKQAKQRLEDHRAKRQAELDAQQATVRAADSAHDPQAQQMDRDLQARFKELEAELKDMYVKEITKLVDLTGSATEAIARSSGIDLVVDTDGVLYQDGSVIDITDLVVARLDSSSTGDAITIPEQPRIAVGYVKVPDATQPAEGNSGADDPMRKQIVSAAAQVAKLQGFRLVVEQWLFKAGTLPDITAPVLGAVNSAG